MGALKSLDKTINLLYTHFHNLCYMLYPSKASLRALCLTQSLSISSTVFGTLSLILNLGSLEVLHLSFRKLEKPPVLLVFVLGIEVALVLFTIIEQKIK
jgi:hypothetical protein